MSDDRDELALVLANAQRVRNGSSRLPSADQCSRLAFDDADAVLAAGYRKPQTIKYVDEMEDLPAGTVILDADGDISRHRGDGYWDSIAEPEEVFHYGDFDGVLPATVLHVGGAA